jgi:hypothetical protein
VYVHGFSSPLGVLVSPDGAATRCDFGPADAPGRAPADTPPLAELWSCDWLMGLAHPQKLARLRRTYRVLVTGMWAADGRATPSVEDSAATRNPYALYPGPRGVPFVAFPEAGSKGVRYPAGADRPHRYVAVPCGTAAAGPDGRIWLIEPTKVGWGFAVYPRDTGQLTRLAGLPTALQPWDFEVSPDGARVAVADGIDGLHLLDVAGDRLVPRLSLVPGGGWSCRAVSFAPDGLTVAAVLRQAPQTVPDADAALWEVDVE